MPESNTVARQVMDDASMMGTALGRARPLDAAMSRVTGRTRAIHKIFEDIAAEHGNRIAISFRGTEVTYRELDALANAVAWRLQGLGVVPGDIVAVILPHSIEIVVTFLAILKCGAAYLPLDDKNPPQRNAQFLRSANVSVIVGSERLDATYRQGRAVVLTSEFGVA